MLVVGLQLRGVDYSKLHADGSQTVHITLWCPTEPWHVAERGDGDGPCM